MASNIAKVEIVDVVLGSSSLLFSNKNIQSSLCYNHKPTSASVRCGLTSELVSIKSITNTHLDYTKINFSGVISEVKLKINHEYLLNKSFLNLNAQSTWYLNGNTIDGNELDSNTLPHQNFLDTVIPSSSCFNMTKQETISKYKILLTGMAKILIYNSAGDRVVDSQLSTIASTMNSGAQVFDNKLIKIPVDGYIEVNLIGAEKNEVGPCEGI